MPNGNWVMMPNGVLNPGDTISVTRTNPHSKTPDTEKATRNLIMSLKGYRRGIILIGEKAYSAFCTDKKDNRIFLIYKEI